MIAPDSQQTTLACSAATPTRTFATHVLVANLPDPTVFLGGLDVLHLEVAAIAAGDALDVEKLARVAESTFGSQIASSIGS
jgi:hypothetical protein